MMSQEMWDQEKKHLAVMNKMQHQHHVRPTLLWELARIGGYGLGAITALMGKEAAMACTEAVETVIGEHYDESVPVPPAPTAGPLTYPGIANSKHLRSSQMTIQVSPCSEKSSKSFEMMSLSISTSPSRTTLRRHPLMHS